MSLIAPNEGRVVMAAQDVRAVIFDCFGVLYLDTTTSILSRVTAEKRQEASDIFMANNYGHFTRDEYVEQMAALTGLSEHDIENYIAKEHHLNAQLVTLISESIRPLFKVGLLSNIGRGWIDDFFTAHQLHDLFDEVVLSGEEGVTKPHPAIYQLMAERLALRPEECVMIDDVEANCEGAEMAGMSAIHFTSNDQLLDDLYKMHIFQKPHDTF